MHAPMPLRFSRLPLAALLLTAAAVPVAAALPAAAANQNQLQGYAVFALASFRGNVYGGTDQGLVRMGSNGSWAMVSGSPLDGREVKGLVVVNGNTLVAATDSGAMRSSDGLSWVSAGLSSHRVASLAVAGGSLFAGTGSEVSTDGMAYRSDDLGASWAPAVSAPALVGLPGAMVQAVLPPAGGAPAWVGTGGSGAYHSADGRSGWSSSTGLASDWVLAFWRDPSNGSRVLVGTDSELATWNGSAWTAASFPQQAPWINVLATGPSGRALAGTDDGAVFAQNADGSWTLRASGLPSVYSLLTLPQGGVLIGTFDGASCIACPASINAVPATPGAHRSDSAPTLPPPGSRGGTVGGQSQAGGTKAGATPSTSGASVATLPPVFAGSGTGSGSGGSSVRWWIVGVLLAASLAVVVVGRRRVTRARS